IVLLYDIACQFGPHLQKHEYTKDLKDFIRVAVNKFHGFAHEYKCSQLWGVHQTTGVGDSDGEGCERVWALLKTIVHS
ncbi:hypothetical protein BJ508DRAFT_196228, partial [Ascobolus immersus RN42]